MSHPRKPRPIGKDGRPILPRRPEPKPPPTPEQAAAKAERAEKRARRQLLVKSIVHSDVSLNDTARGLVHLLVWEGLKRKEAIKRLEISEGYAYQLLANPEVMGHYRKELQVLRESGLSRVQHRLEEIVEQDDNLTAAVQAAKLLLPDPKAAAAAPVVNVNVLPGWVIDPSRALSRGDQLGRLTTSEPKTIEHQQDAPRPTFGTSQTGSQAVAPAVDNQSPPAPVPAPAAEAPRAADPGMTRPDAPMGAPAHVRGGGPRFWRATGRGG